MVGAILTANGREFCGTTIPLELYFAPNDIGHRQMKVKSSQTNRLLSGLIKLLG